MPTFGRTQNDGASSSTAYIGRWHGGYYELTEKALVSKLTGRFAGGTEAVNAKGVIYAADGTYVYTGTPNQNGPGTLLGASNPTVIAATTDPQVLDFNFASAVALDAGWYWIGFIYDHDGGVTNARFYQTWNGSAYIYGQITSGMNYTTPANPALAVSLEDYTWPNVYATYTVVVVGEIHLYDGTPTAAATDGTEVTETLTNPVEGGDLTLGETEDLTDPLKLAVRCNTGWARSGSFTITPSGTTQTAWRLAPDSAGSPGTWGAWGDPLTLAGPIGGTNTIWWVQARNLPTEDTPATDISVTLAHPVDNIVAV